MTKNKQEIAEKSVRRTTDQDLCVSCGACFVVCPQNAILMLKYRGKFTPQIDTNKCIQCGLCQSVCPGLNPDPHNYRSLQENESLAFDEEPLAAYTGYALDKKIRQAGISGSLVSLITTKMLKDGSAEVAYLLPGDILGENQAQTEPVTDYKKVLSYAGSKYIPASVSNTIEGILKYPARKTIVVGTPCQLQAIKNVLAKKRVSSDNILFLGLVCDRTMNFNIVKYFEKKHTPTGSATGFEFRTKEGGGWPGHSKIRHKEGSKIVDRSERMKLKDYYQLKRCTVCLSGKLNPFADITFSDCYLPGQENKEGTSNIIVRSNKGQEILDKYKDEIYLEKANIAEIRKSQGLYRKRRSLEYLKVVNVGAKLYPDLDAPTRAAQKSYLGVIKKIKLGSENKISAIELDIKVKRASQKAKKLGKVLKLTLFLLYRVTADIFSLLVKKDKKDWENILIVGGGVHNKGAQAMTLLLIKELEKEYPGKKYYVLNKKYHALSAEERVSYKVGMLPYSDKEKLIQLTRRWGIFEEDLTQKPSSEDIGEVFKKAGIIYDVSGYALSSQIGFKQSLFHILNFMIARTHNVKYIVMPQSFGPFKYGFLKNLLICPLINIYLRTASRVYVREEEGLTSLKRFGYRRATLSPDSVLLFKGDQKSLIKAPARKAPALEKDAVIIVLNKHIFDRVAGFDVMNSYKKIITALVHRGKRVYILRHSDEDTELNKKLYDGVSPSDKKNVFLLNEDYYAYELEALISEADYVVGSRYHSVVHAYKQGTPAVVIGWAVKYQELTKMFRQTAFFFGGEDLGKPEKIIKALELLEKNRAKEARAISSVTARLQKEYKIDMRP